MHPGRSIRRLVSWIACFAILVGALAPGVSHALQSRAGDSTWVEVCTALGAKRVKVDASSDESTSPAGPLLEHCPYCSLHADQFAMPPVPLSVPALSMLHAGPPERFLSAPRTPFAWAAAQPRAPPRVS
ncbi:DUF2946 domain-containing protein [Piscinibacter gummiphilus]|uniref:Uncharacterized protein n=1 Tax=Piscinibacter gummiphilus TaxID=946333 RepID=A0A1W6L5F5_9BURK|nr:DUF2946 domain-containing protein [Piscinibacter gummiphilus]ARN19561.1 hypothetical protein A4W93_06335 [Piscinibacter gummiphilus]ATU64229.1 DUF2946 domain-containing protein [Piscinibacter gummiphilus]GLS92789.1 hypothetical protein GCM10007918_00800 [Piscinibacter gummiphilus]